jgi:hypothetical protein
MVDAYEMETMLAQLFIGSPNDIVIELQKYASFMMAFSFSKHKTRA